MAEMVNLLQNEDIIFILFDLIILINLLNTNVYYNLKLKQKKQNRLKKIEIYKIMEKKISYK